MSIHRRAARRDGNEPEIRKRFAFHGWHTEQVSGTGMPDLMCWPEPMVLRGWAHDFGGAIPSFLVDVKMPDGRTKPAQVSKWTYLRLQGIPVYVVRTVDDVDALVAGVLEPWKPPMTAAEIKKAMRVAEEARAARPPREPVDVRTRLGTPVRRKVDIRPMGMGHALRDQDPKWLRDRAEDTRRAADAIAAEPLESDGRRAAKVAQETFAPCSCGDSQCNDCAGAR